MSPDNAWTIIQGIETLSLRMERHCENFLKVHDEVAWVGYPGLPNDPQHSKTSKYLKGKGGPMVVFGIQSDHAQQAGQGFIDSLQLISHVANVGDCKSLAIHPASTTHSQLNEEQQRAAGVSPELIRLSVGIETVEDILQDLRERTDNPRI